MNLTALLKSWLTDQKLVNEAASDDEFKAAALAALQDGTLTPAKLAELTVEKEPEDELGRIIGDAVGKAVESLGTRLDAMEAAAESRNAEKLADKIDQAAKQATPAEPVDASQKAAEMFQGAAAAASQPRVKEAVERYGTSKGAVFHAKDSQVLPGERAMFGDKPLDSPSQRDLAVSAAWFKHTVNAGRNGHQLPRHWRMTDHDKQLLQWALHNETFSGPTVGHEVAQGRKLNEVERKTLLDEVGSSQGEAAVPDVFDEAVILTPVLHGELFPLVTVVPLARGSSVDGFSLGNPSVGYVAEGGAISEFNTAAMIAGFDTTIFPVTGAITLGLDFVSDSPVDIGAILVRQYGEQFMNWLDNQIANGDGTSEPTGIMLSTGETGTDIGAPAGGAGEAPQIDDYELLMFSVGKEYQPRQDWPRCVFIANLTTYRRARSIAVSGSDARRVFGMTHRDYNLLEAPFKIENNLASSRAGFYNMRRYRMYRRLGMQVRVETGGKTLALDNEELIVVRQRWGGQFEATLAGAYSNSFEA